jgi:hypothetical protein
MFHLTTPLADLELWPAATSISDQDIVVSGISLLRLVDVCGTPAVHSAESVSLDSRRAPLADTETAVLVVRVLAAERHASGLTAVEFDARLDNLRIVWSEGRVLGRRTAGRRRLFLVSRRPGVADLAVTTDVSAMRLPVDLHVGDLVAFPSRSIPTNAVGEVHPLTGTTDWRPESVHGAFST